MIISVWSFAMKNKSFAESKPLVISNHRNILLKNKMTGISKRWKWKNYEDQWCGFTCWHVLAKSKIIESKQTKVLSSYVKIHHFLCIGITNFYELSAKDFFFKSKEKFNASRLVLVFYGQNFCSSLVRITSFLTFLGSLTKSCCDFVNLSIRFDKVKGQISRKNEQFICTVEKWKRWQRKWQHTSILSEI